MGVRSRSRRKHPSAITSQSLTTSSIHTHPFRISSSHNHYLSQYYPPYPLALHPGKQLIDTTSLESHLISPPRIPQDIHKIPLACIIALTPYQLPPPAKCHANAATAHFFATTFPGTNRDKEDLASARNAFWDSGTIGLTDSWRFSTRLRLLLDKDGWKFNCAIA